MTQTPPSMDRLSRRMFLALSAAAATLTACARYPSPSTARPAAPALPTPSASAPPPSATAAPTAIPGRSAAAPEATAPLATPTPAASSTPAASTTPTATTAAGEKSGTSTPIPLPQNGLNVRKFGAAGDGTTDDTAAIRAAIAAAPAGGAIIFPPGIYIVSPSGPDGIAIKSNLRILGSGEQSIIKIKDHVGNWQSLFTPRVGESVENVAFEDLAFDANILNNPESTIDAHIDETYQTFISVTAGRGIHIRRCYFNPYAGVWAVSLNGETIRDCSVTDSYFRFVMREGNPDYDNSAVYIEGSNYTLSGNRFESSPTPYHEARACMEAHGGPAEVFNNTASGYQTLLNIVGSYFPGGNSSDIVCRDNVATNALIGIMLWPTTPNILSNVTVTNNTIDIAQLMHGTADTGGISVIFSPEARGHATNIAITNNTIRFQDEGTGRPGDFYYNSGGILLHNLGGVSGCAIERNIIERAPSAGIVIGLPEPGDRMFRNVRVTNNTVINSGQNVAFPAEFRAGILVNSNASHLDITGNAITETYPTPRCRAAIAFDLTSGNRYIGINVKDNVARAINGPLSVILPITAER